MQEMVVLFRYRVG